MDMPRNVFRLTPSFVTVACPNKAVSHEEIVHNLDIEHQGWLWLWLWLWGLWWWFCSCSGGRGEGGSGGGGIVGGSGVCGCGGGCGCGGRFKDFCYYHSEKKMFPLPL